jgi:hypothetical protein
MREILGAVAVLLTFALTANAINLKAYNGNIEFDHMGHRKNFACTDCHEGPPRHFEMTKESAHKLCLGCHKKVGAGPLVHCSDCHKAS